MVLPDDTIWPLNKELFGLENLQHLDFNLP
jgi:hypothetical protein